MRSSELLDGMEVTLDSALECYGLVVIFLGVVLCGGRLKFGALQMKLWEFSDVIASSTDISNISPCMAGNIGNSTNTLNTAGILERIKF